MKNESILPKLIGAGNYRNLIVCWGSTLNAVCEAVKILGRNDTSVLHFSQVYPLNGDAVAGVIGKAEKTVVVENNATGQFERILKINAGVEFSHRILKYNGLAFAADELAGKLVSLL
jgi:2-oxoglutarate ferredoxin oxidoreductase subunit alpha